MKDKEDQVQTLITPRHAEGGGTALDLREKDYGERGTHFQRDIEIMESKNKEGSSEKKKKKKKREEIGSGNEKEIENVEEKEGENVEGGSEKDEEEEMKETQD
jgi:hypothetical protein